MNLLCGAPVREDVPHDAVVAETCEEFQYGVARRQFLPLSEAAQGEKFPVGRSHVPLVRAVLADADDEGLDRLGGFVVDVLESKKIFKSYRFFKSF